MLVVLRVREDGIWIVINRDPYSLKIKFLANRKIKISDRPLLYAGTKVSWDVRKPMLAEF